MTNIEKIEQCIIELMQSGYEEFNISFNPQAGYYQKVSNWVNDNNEGKENGNKFYTWTDPREENQSITHNSLWIISPEAIGVRKNEPLSPEIRNKIKKDCIAASTLQSLLNHYPVFHNDLSLTYIITNLEKELLKLLKGEFTSIDLGLVKAKNQDIINELIEDYDLIGNPLKTNQPLWTLIVYPNNPSGSYRAISNTLTQLLNEFEIDLLLIN